MKFTSHAILGSLMLLFVVSFVSCKALVKGSKIQGEVKGAENMSVTIEQMSLSSQGNSLITEKADAAGKFEIKFPDGMKKGIYRIKIGAQAVDIISDGTEKQVKFSCNLADLAEFKYKIEGSPLSELYFKTVTNYITTQDGPAMKEVVMKEVDPLVAFQIATQLFRFSPEVLDVHKAVSERLKTTYPDLALNAEYQTVIGQLEQQVKMEQAAQKIQLGMPAPDISLPGPDGKMRKLSDYKGKLVLIDFWASWCGPCRQANPHVVEIYNKYKSKGFDVFSVSLDGVDPRQAGSMDAATLAQAEVASKERWKGAIVQDGLLWDGHVSDLKKWTSAPASEYGVRSIPQTFLVGRDGKIIAINPRNDLEQQVSKNI